MLYELPVESLTLTLGGGVEVDASLLLSSGRANYILFQDLVARCMRWQRGGEGATSDLRLPDGRTAEVKAFHDIATHPSTAEVYERVHTAASSTFGPNNQGPVVKRLLAAGDYTGALAVCHASGYAKNDFYVYTNTRGFRPSSPLRYLVLPTATVVANLSPDDPREIRRSTLLSLAKRVVRIDPKTLSAP